MRISTQQVFLNNIDNLNKANNDLFKTQQQIATGKRVLQPSDDPLASAQIQKFKKEVARTEQFGKNIDVSERRLTLEENAISQVNNMAIRLRELSIQSNSAILTSSELKGIAAEVGQILSELEGLMNTKDVQGEYLFSGHKGFTQAYSFDETLERYVFNGDDGQRYIQIGPDTKIAATDSGFEVFEKINKVPGYVVPNLQQSGSQVSDVELVDPDLLDSFVQSRGELQISFDTGAGTYSVTDSQTPPVVVATGNIADGSIDLTADAGVVLTIGTVAADTTVTLGAFSQHNILNTALDLKTALETADTVTDAGRAAFSQSISNVLSNLSEIEERNGQSIASIGGRLNALEQQYDVNEEYKIFTKEALSSFEDLDYNEAISRFELQKTVLEASYASFAQVQGLNLFSYLN
ncbi:flagellar hook-associated protein FlgL [Pontibacter sp. JAM-7]|uniref:flagellar hook-associated protein FlgL n=1 Tax=Pontibacter sp. JAM-7 TaxID=3366581 RepID=UPI003AF86CBF